MKKLILTLVTFTGVAMANPYYVDSMVCKGEIKGDTTNVHPSFNTIKIKFTSFLSKRKDGTFAKSLRTAQDYAYTIYKLPKDPGGEVFYGASLEMQDNKVVSPDKDYKFKIISRKNGIDTLTGRYNRGSSYYYALNCTAKVIKKPVRISDLTVN